jgi:hypothetical protein
MVRNNVDRPYSMQFPYDPLHGTKEAPTSGARVLLESAVERFARYGPKQLEALLTHEGTPVPIGQIRGYLAGMYVAMTQTLRRTPRPDLSHVVLPDGAADMPLVAQAEGSAAGVR